LQVVVGGCWWLQVVAGITSHADQAAVGFCWCLLVLPAMLIRLL
jgi:hypothetical protein